MPDLETYLARWQSAGILDRESDAGLIARMRTLEAAEKKPTGLRWQGLIALILGAILLACGVVLFVSAHWDQISPLARFALVLAMVSVFHLCGAISRSDFHSLSTTLHAVGTISTGAAIALVGQIFNMQEHWPAAILLWAIAAFAGWALLHDQAQQTLTLLLFPAWLISELAYAAEGYVGAEVYLGRILIVWATLYLTIFLSSRRKAVRGILFTAAAIAAFVGTDLMFWSWRSWTGHTTFLPLSARIWDWGVIAAVPIFFTLFRRRESLVPVLAAILFAIILPWCNRLLWTPFDRRFYSDSPNLAGFALTAAFAIFMSWWGVRNTSRALVNLSMTGFAVVVMFFYFSDIFDKVGRSIGLIGLGILFLAGGWLLEKTRRRLIDRFAESTGLPETA
ncbi:DUF2157 domain-containing protein [Acidicapsa acidisoli]|uniref:DUF2157 domain-containing protein n=1 Tax=Acidicapsa acidisoli TaxID=1615681 RepID=UPI0021DF5909|nr:DUF2157 domain-containing protein [Acidicapsa acidisoli]